MSFLLTGQTDSGKSTIAGNLLVQVNYFNSLPEEDRKVYRNYLENLDTNNSKSKYSILMDLLDGEILNNKTKTQEFSIHNFSHKETKYMLIDTPGHQLYIRSLLEGLFHTNPTVICLVVSSLENEFTESWEKGTVKEDLLLSRSIGCKHLLILWNKTDIREPSRNIQNKLNTFCKGLKFTTTDSLFVSGYTGKNVLEILKYVSNYTKEGKEEKEEIKMELREKKERREKKIQVKGMFFLEDRSILISPGLQFVLHHSTGEYESEIDSMRDLSGKETRIVRVSEPLEINLSILNNTIIYERASKVVFRYQKKTIGFGVLN